MATSIKRECSRRLIAWALALGAASVQAGGGHPHGEAAHAAHDAVHEHAAEPTLVYTHFSDVAELFVEFPPLVVNRAATFVAHFTDLDNFQPFHTGVVDVILRQGGRVVARFRVKAPTRPGIFLPAVTAKRAGDYDLSLELQAGTRLSRHELGRVRVFTSMDETEVDQPQTEGEIRYLKEQQWLNPFALVQVAPRGLRPSVPGFATVTAPADGYAVVRAPSDGYFTAADPINAGTKVTQNQWLGSLIPRLGEGADIGSLLVAQERARAQWQLAEADATRLQGLYEQGAIPEKRWQEANQARDVAKVEWQTAQSRLQQRSGKEALAGLALRAPIAGEVVHSATRPGAFHTAGDALFTLASADKRWLSVQVPEHYGRQLHRASGVWFDDGASVVVLDETSGAQRVNVSQWVTPANRTVTVTFEYAASQGQHLLGERFAAKVYVGETVAQLSVPFTAIVDDGGQPVVYLQAGGESFSRRAVTLGLRDGDWVAVESGLNAGDRVVSRGAYYVKLAAAGGDAIGHGHAH